MSVVRVLVADDHAIVREGLRTLIASEPNMVLAGEAADGIEAVSQALALRPDVTLMDLLMPHKDGLEAIREIKTQRPRARILVLTSFSGDDKVFPAIKAGAVGYLLKDTLPEKLLGAIYAVSRGELFLHPSVALKLIRELDQPSDLPPTENPLTEREMTVLKLVAQGLTDCEIADRLAISVEMVYGCTRSILSKLHQASCNQLALYALEEQDNRSHVFDGGASKP